MKRSSGDAPVVATLERILAKLEATIDAKIEARLGAALGGEYLDQVGAATALGITRRAYLEAARAGEFPVHKVGRRVFAAVRDLRAWIERKRRGRRGPGLSPLPDDEAMLIAAGLKFTN